MQSGLAGGQDGLTGSLWIGRSAPRKGRDNVILTVALAFIALTGVIWHIVSTITITEFLKERGHKVMFIWIRLLGPKYAHQYKKITLEETGKVGPLFYHWIVSINVALVTGILAIVLKP
jgi:hypothetical protein